MISASEGGVLAEVGEREGRWKYDLELQPQKWIDLSASIMLLHRMLQLVLNLEFAFQLFPLTHPLFCYGEGK